ncbi:hypothetical protein TNCV_527761 [Trichonephila clavipes]|nr:hypothetical protein TNCV_527761 [Trichonephila clavipes]
MMGQYYDDECTLPMFVYHDTVKHGCDHLDAVNGIWIHLEKRTSRPGSFVDHTIEDTPVCDKTSRVAASMVSEL